MLTPNEPPNEEEPVSLLPQPVELSKQVSEVTEANFFPSGSMVEPSVN